MKLGQSSLTSSVVVRALVAGIATLVAACGAPVDATEEAEQVGSTNQAIQAANTWSKWYMDTNGGIKALPANVFANGAPAVSSAWEGYCSTTCDSGHQLLRVVQYTNSGKYYQTYWTPNNGWLAGWTALSTQTFSRAPAMTSWDFPIVNQPQASISLVAGVVNGAVKTFKLGTGVTQSTTWSSTNITGCAGNAALTQDQPGSASGDMYLFCANNDSTIHGWRIAKSSFGINGHPTTWTQISNTTGTIEPSFAVSAGQIWGGQVNVFAQDPVGQQYWVNYFNLSSGSWAGWQMIPQFTGANQSFNTGPTAAVTRGTGGRVDVFGLVLTDNGGSAVVNPVDIFYSDAAGAWTFNPNLPNTDTNANRAFGGVGASLFTYFTGGAAHKYIELFTLDQATGKLKESVYRYPTNLGG